MRSLWRRWALAAAAVVALVVVLDRVFPPPLHRGEAVAGLVLDRSGRPLRAFPAPGGRWRFAADLTAIDPLFVEALFAVEDKRFHSHWGVDPAALIRAFGTSLRAGRVVSGASTITMQTARLLEPRERTLGAKFIEMIRAVQIETRLSKREILELYLTLAPYGGNLEGVRAASLAYFGREPDRLSDDQIALLIALPQSPELRRPDRRPERAASGRQAIAAKLGRAGVLSEARAMEAAEAALPARRPFPSRAWHAAAAAWAGAAGRDVGSTIDGTLQADLEALIAAEAAGLEPDAQLAALVAHIPSRAVLAAVGSAARDRPGGWIDLTDQPRSPGSTLKPFIYGVAFDDGAAAPRTRIADLPARFAGYRPENFDRSFRGDVTIAEALQHSLNVPAVLALDRIGPARFAAQLSAAGAPPRLSASAEREVGLALALGGAGLTLRELAVLYAALGDGGIAKPLAWRIEDAEATAASPGARLLSAESAAELLDILAAGPSPAGRAPGRLTEAAPQIAFKTGTSYGYRDAWAAGVAGDIVIVVWVGRADGAPRPGAIGRSAALPVLFRIADRAASGPGHGGRSADRLRGPAGQGAPSALARFDRSDHRPEILFPPAGAELWPPPSARPFVFSGSGQGALSWYVDGAPVGVDDGGSPVWTPPGPGFFKVSAVDRAGREAHAAIRVLAPPP